MGVHTPRWSHGTRREDQAPVTHAARNGHRAGLPPQAHAKGEHMASIAELRELITRTQAAAQDAPGTDRPLLMAQADTLRAELARRTSSDDEEPSGHAIGSDGQVAEVIGGAAYLDGT